MGGIKKWLRLRLDYFKTHDALMSTASTLLVTLLPAHKTHDALMISYAYRHLLCIRYAYSKIPAHKMGYSASFWMNIEGCWIYSFNARDGLRCMC